MPYCCKSVLKPHTCNCSGYNRRCCVPAFSVQSQQRCSIVCPPPVLNTFSIRSCRSQQFRLFYERGDLPCRIHHTTKGQELKWLVNDIEQLNIDYYLPIFTDGLCETKYPYSFIAMQGIFDLVERASHKINIETLSKMIAPLKRALYTFDPVVIRRVLLVLQKLAHGNDGAIGIALVPYFNQLLPIINVMKERSQEKSHQCDLIDYGQRDQNDLARLIGATLLVLEQFGGHDAFINIKYSIPTYEQQVDLRPLSTAQTDMIAQPLMTV